ncbi:hypothetical protein DN069_02525 [Streptacidiphilus pinicola]|uniref:Uncharacterized protein n=1 Tax=Streptacidiphilus pinicola TaxID=2219663 RepID=A0A2X0JHR8_9ACTN|nr:hypothetical protein [Streptacidiphilus pinicola]RAG87218.1 hypothetical protein DN069_02525 [Streptacidiphilus pinicola]
MRDEGVASATGQPTLWRRVRRGLWQPPSPHGASPRERVVGPRELFYDLVGGALLVRPDGHIATRWREHPPNPVARQHTLAAVTGSQAAR